MSTFEMIVSQLATFTLPLQPSHPLAAHERTLRALKQLGRPVTRNELAAFMETGQRGVRQHLTILNKEGRVLYKRPNGSLSSFNLGTWEAI